jgi:hypothetical protein
MHISNWIISMGKPLQKNENHDNCAAIATANKHVQNVMISTVRTMQSVARKDFQTSLCASLKHQPEILIRTFAHFITNHVCVSQPNKFFFISKSGDVAGFMNGNLAIFFVLKSVPTVTQNGISFR